MPRLSDEPDPNRLSVERECEIAYDLWTTLCTACVLSTLRETDQHFIAELETRSVHRHQDKYFFPGLKKLQLDTEPNDVIKCAKYHFFSNSLGGLPMHYVEERPDKVWIRYLSPYWMGDGPTLPATGAAVLSSLFGRAPYLGWHAHNGSYLGNDRLVFVQTQSLCDGDPWDGGYFTIHDQSMPPGRAFLRRIGEWGPPPDPATTPQLPHAQWPSERRAKALRNYGIDFTVSRYATLVEMLGDEKAAEIIAHSWTVVLAQRKSHLQSIFGTGQLRTASDAAAYLAGVAMVSGEEITITRDGKAFIVNQSGSRMWRSEAGQVDAIDKGIQAVWANHLSACNPNLSLRVTPTASGWSWIIAGGI